MSGWPRIYYKLLNLPLSVGKSKSIPAEPALELGLDTSRPIMYVLPYNSKADLLTLRAQCLAHDLPDPLEPLEVDGTLLPRYVFIHGGPRVFTYYTPKEESIKLFHDYLDLHRSNPDLDVQMVPVSVMFGRRPGRGKRTHRYACLMASRNSSPSLAGARQLCALLPFRLAAPDGRRARHR